MSFSYRALDEDKQIVNENSFLLLFLYQLSNQLVSLQEALELEGETNKFAIDYYSASLDYVNKILGKRGVDDESEYENTDKNQITEIAETLRANIAFAKEKVSGYGERLFYITDLQEIGAFIKELVLLCVKDIKVSSRFVYHKGVLHNFATWTIVYDGINWVWETDTHNADVFCYINIDGTELTHEESNAIPQLVILKAMITGLIDDELSKEVIKEHEDDDEVMTITNKIASVLGGKPEKYIPLLLDVNDSLSKLSATGAVNNIQLKRELRSRLRVDEDTLELLTNTMLD